MKKLFTAISGLCLFAASLLGNDLLYLVSVGFGGFFVAIGAIRGLIKQRFLNIDFLVLIASIGALYIQQWAEAAAVVFFFSLAEAFESFGIQRSKQALETLLQKTPAEALLTTGEKVKIDDIKLGDLITVRSGELIPLDGIVKGGTSSVDESTITGESIPQDKESGSHVFAGTLNQHGALEIEVTKESKDSTFSKIAHLVEEAQKSKAPIQEFMDRFAKYYIPFIVGIAILITTIPPFIFGGTFESWFYRALIILVISCPCALVLSAPIAMASALGGASKRGILIKGGEYLDLLSKIKAIALDKTRTLTIGKPTISDVLPTDAFTEEDILKEAAGVEKFSTHPLSASILEYAKQKGIRGHEMEDYQNIPGKGGKATCRVCNETYRVGNLKLINASTHTQQIIKKAEQLEKQGKTIVIVSKNQDIMGIIAVSDVIRPEAETLISRLYQLNIHPVMLTGDNTYTAEFVAQNLGIQELHASLLPDQKSDKINALKKKFGTIAMVGDGVNDAPSLATATVGIAMGIEGSDMAIETADIILMNDNLLNIPDAIRLSKKTMRIIKVNIGLALTTKAIFLISAILGLSSLETAITADSGVAILVILNSLRLFYFK